MITRSVDARTVRREFLEFFAERGHRVVPSAPVFPQDDPTLLFTNAGMNQFKDVFLGTGKRAYTRAVDTQKCIRVSGKHNDLEEVGVDTYHHTFFEMLGNWSFGDYFKAEAIPWAWELLTGVWGLPKERLWVTVFGGDEKDGLPADEDAERIWRETTDIDPARVLRFGRKDNFWEMGDTGPCGPCSEIHIDRGGAGTDPRDGADRAKGVNAGNERFMELWNLVFMEFNRLDDGRLQTLPAQHVDTGMGFERILGVLQGKRSNYDSDLFTPLFARLAKIAGRPYRGGTSEEDVAFRVVADHVRAVTSAFADGALPSNTGRGYVLRRLIRRASRYGRQVLGLEEPFLCEVAPAVAEVLGEAFPEIALRIDHVRGLLREEELAFGKTLGRGLVQFERLRARTSGRALPGHEAYELYATYGFPQDLVELMCREHGLQLDAEGWRTAHEEHQAASRSEGKFKQLVSAEKLAEVPPTRSLYHDDDGGRTQATSTVVGYLPAEGEGAGRLLLAESPFYPEAGGQVGDRGTIAARDGGFRFLVDDTQRIGEVVVHLGRLEGRVPAAGEAVLAAVDGAARERTRRHHTATHLLHKALREVLGEHVTQQGSYVGPDRLRFDFAHPKGLGADEIEEIERRVNAAIVNNSPVGTTVEDLAAAKARGVTALFGEKYAERVRVVDVGGWSTELCGGTHVRAAGDIGAFVVLGERAIQAGVRRLEAVVGDAALAEIQRQRRVLGEAARALKVAVDEVPERIAALQTQLKEAKKDREKAQSADLGALFAELSAKLTQHGGVAAGVFVCPDLGAKDLGELANRLHGKHADLALALFGEAEGKVPFVVVCEGAARERGLDAARLAGEAKALLGGGGGGKPTRAQGQGLDPAQREAASQRLHASIRTALGGD